jgi:hypothetical protein
VSELTLQDWQRDTFAGEFNSVGMAKLVLVPTSAQSSLSRPARYADLVEKCLFRAVMGPELSA